jgi:hypothetical protein
MQWRNEQMDILRQNQMLRPDEQKNYFHKVVEPTFTQEKPNQILFSFLNKQDCIGYGGLTHVDWSKKKAEVSFLLATERSKNIEIYKKEFAIFLNLLKQVAFQDLSLKELFTETYDIRPLHIQVLEDQGFVFEKRLKDHAIKGEAKLDSLFHTCRRQHGF